MRRGSGLLACLVLLLSPGGCDLSILGDLAEEPYELTADWPSGATLQVDWIDGEVEVVIDESASGIRLTGTKRVSAATEEEANLLLPGLDITVVTQESEPPTVVVEMDTPSVTSIAQFTADVRVVIPAAAVLTIGGANCPVSVTSNGANTTVTVSNGGVEIVDQQGGSIMLDVGNGTVGVESRESSVDITVSNGDVEVTDEQGGMLDINVGRGEVLVQSSGSNLQAAVTSGSIAVNASPLANGFVGITGTTLLVGVAVPPDFDAFMDLDTTQGVITADLDQFEESNVLVTETSISATLGAGGGLIDVDVVTGDIIFQALN